jgi:hypothetical protein
MKRIISSVLASSLCFTGSLPVFAGGAPVPIPPTSGLGVGSGTVINTIITITITIQINIFTQITNFFGQPGNGGGRFSLLFALLTGGGSLGPISMLPEDLKQKQMSSGSDVSEAQKEAINSLLALGLDYDGGLPVRQLVGSLTGLFPFGLDEKTARTPGAVDATKLTHSIAIYNSIVEKVISESQGQGPAAEKAKATLAKMESDELFQAISGSLKAIRKGFN